MASDHIAAYMWLDKSTHRLLSQAPGCHNYDSCDSYTLDVEIFSLLAKLSSSSRLSLSLPFLFSWHLPIHLRIHIMMPAMAQKTTNTTTILHQLKSLLASSGVVCVVVPWSEPFVTPPIDITLLLLFVLELVWWLLGLDDSCLVSSTWSPGVVFTSWVSVCCSEVTCWGERTGVFYNLDSDYF